MSKKNWHLKKYLSGKIPEPDIPADDAWTQMGDMLGKIPVPDLVPQQPGIFKYFLKYGLGVLAGVATVCTPLYFLTKDQNHESQLKHHAVLNEKHSDSLAVRTHQQALSFSGQPATIPIQDSSVSNLPAKQHQKINLTGTAAPNSIVSSKNKNKNTISDSPLQSKRNANYVAGHLKGNNMPGNIQVDRQRESEKENSSSRQKKIGNQSAADLSPTSEFIHSPYAPLNMKSPVHLTEEAFLPINDKLAGEVLKTGSIQKVNLQPTPRISFSVQMLDLKPVGFTGASKNLSTIVRYAYKNEVAVKQPEKVEHTFSKAIQIGLEWNAATSFRDTKYIFTGADSTKRPYLLLIPGVWFSKKLTHNQQLTAGFNFYQPYFGGSKLIRKIPETNVVGSTNTRLIKAVGMNLALQYEYLLFSNWKFSAGIGYSRLTRALFIENYVNYANEPLDGSMVSFQRQDLKSLIKPNLFTFQPGISFEWQRFQLGANLIAPLGNVSATSMPVRSMNGRVFFRLRLY